MAHDTKRTRGARGERPKRRGWDRRRDLGRRMIRDRRRTTAEVPFERRSGGDRRSLGQRRANAERRVTPPEGFHLLDGEGSLRRRYGRAGAPPWPGTSLSSVPSLP